MTRPPLSAIFHTSLKLPISIVPIIQTVMTDPAITKNCKVSVQTTALNPPTVV